MSNRHCAERVRSHRFTTLGMLLALLLAGAIAIPIAAAAADDAACTGVEPLPLNSTLRRQHEIPSAPEIFRLSIPTSGVLALDVSAPIAADHQPRLAFLGTSCTWPAPGDDDAAYVPIAETPQGLVLKIAQADELFVAVFPEDPAVPLDDYRLRASFAAAPTAPDEVLWLTADPPASCTATAVPSFSPQPLTETRMVELRREGMPTKEVDPIDWDVLSGRMEAPGVLTVETAGSPLRASIHAGVDCRPADRLAEGTLDAPGALVAATVPAGERRLVLETRTTSDAGYELLVTYFALCTAAEDDHDDRFLCATPMVLGEVTTGVLGNAFGDDEDAFAFTVAGLETVAVELVGGNALRAELYDAVGQRLAAWPAGRLVRTLGAGRFTVRVGSVEPWGGEYAVRVEAVTVP